MGGEPVHRDGVPHGLHDQLPLLPPLLPRHRTRPVRGMTASLDEGLAAARAVHARHDENFPVLVRLLPREVRDDMRVVYAFCRHTD
ncbi:MAG: squalene/phytoene synthase family protein, partial [Actinomycetota bacterium]